MRISDWAVAACARSRGLAVCRIAAAMLLLMAASPAPAQNSEFQFAPEIDAHLKLSPQVRLQFNGQLTREDGKGTGGNFAANADFFMKPLLRMKSGIISHLDESKSQLLVLRAGYAHYRYTDSGPENRMVLEATPRYPLVGGALFTNRLRADLRFVTGKPFSWRFRDRLALERTFSIAGYHVTPYLREEAFYDSNHEKWSRTSFDAGSTFPLGKRYEFELYYEHQNDTSKAPNQQTNTLGMVLNLYFSP